MNRILRINQEKCNGCGLCVNDCLSRVIDIDSGIAVIHDHSTCLLCGHCGAICPQAAITFDNEIGIEFKGFRNVEFNQLDQMIKMKRSIRQYKDQAVDNESIEKILEIGRVSPTGGNRQPLKFTVVNHPEKMEELKLLAMKTLYEYGQHIEGRYKIVFNNMLKNYLETGFDRLFYNAPTLISIYGDAENSANIAVDAGIAAGQMSLIAETLGLGSCFIGFLNFAAEQNGEIYKLLKIPEGNKLMVNIILGHKDVQYIRTVPRNELNVTYL